MLEARRFASEVIDRDATDDARHCGPSTDI